MNTICEKCIFANHADTADPCEMNIINRINNKHKIDVSSNNFYTIQDYSCKYGFSIDIYNKYKSEIGSIDCLKKEIYNQSQVCYYLIVYIKDISNIDMVCQAINKLEHKPKFISLLLQSANNTDTIIQNIKNTLDKNLEWKLHNFLENIDINEKLSVVLDTNAKKNDTIYFWLNTDDQVERWVGDIININKIIYIDQPRCHALFRSSSNDGLFLSFDQYKQMKSNINFDIFKAINSIQDVKLIYYA